MLVLLLLFFRKVLPPACHLERSPPEILPSLCSVLLRSSTPLRFAQNDTGGRSRNPKGERQCRSDLAGRLKPALWKAPLCDDLFFFSDELPDEEPREVRNASPRVGVKKKGLLRNEPPRMGSECHISPQNKKHFVRSAFCFGTMCSARGTRCALRA